MVLYSFYISSIHVVRSHLSGLVGCIGYTLKVILYTCAFPGLLFSHLLGTVSDYYTFPCFCASQNPLKTVKPFQGRFSILNAFRSYVG